MKRRSVLGMAAGLSIGTVAAAPGRAEAAPGEQLGNYASHLTDARSVTVTSVTGQRLRITAYGNQIVRVRAVRSGETFFADTRYEMVVPANHAGMGGSLSVSDSGATLTVLTGAADGIRIVLQKNPLRLEFYHRATGALLAKEDATQSIAWGGTNNSVVTEAFVPPPVDEHFVKAGHGMYGRSPRIDRTGDVVSHNYGAGNDDQAPAIVPLYLSTKGYGVFFNTTFDTTFSFASGTGKNYAFSADDHGTAGVRPQMDYFLINGPQFAKLLDRYTQLTGRPRLPQLSIFGLHMSDKTFPGVSDQSWWRTKITQHRSAGFPFDHQVNDNRWRAGSGGWSGSWFEFDPGRWPDPAGYEAWAAANGVTVTLDYNRNNSSRMAGWVGGPPPGYSFKASDLTRVSDNGSVPDWSNPATRAWVWNVFWSKALDPALGYPCDGLWLDETDQMGPIPFNADTANGRKWSELRNAYFFYLLKGVGEEGWDPQTAGHIGAAKRPWTWSRSASAGQQRYGHYWTGDIASTYDEMRQQIRGMLTGGLGGFPYSNVDGGGFHGGAGGLISEPFYRNWPAAWSSLSPIWRPHGQSNTATQGPVASRWPLDQSPIIQADFRKYGELRYTLLPYIYSLAHEAAATGMPMARAMVIDYQSRPNAYAHDLQYMWGPSLLVAPVTSDGGATQNVWLPAGATWYNFWADIKHVGTDSADLPYVTRTGEIILFVKAGAILPKYPYAQSTAFLSKRQLELEIYAGADGSFNLVEDDGTTESYRVTGARSTTALTYTDAATRTTIAHPQGTYAGAPAARRYVVRIHGLTSPVGMRVNGGGTLPSYNSEATAITSGGGTVWDGTRKILSVVTPSIPSVVGGGVAATVEPSGSAFPAATGGTVYQAELALVSRGVIDTRHPDYTGTGFVDLPDSSATGAYIQWTVAVPAAGTRTLTIRYANGSGANRPLAISVNGATVNSALPFNPTGSWSTWSTTSFTASLPAGSQIAVRATITGSSGANIDSLTIT
ncbi:TIM-barrel domain-containing protein [Micromonospora sp. LH3U1]|uniref:TIM-barrel domain-containing protein n=1 Tax=Micromonospora sp. LH3U1 TaxID=3018339 RepID=UPI002349BFDC|nr:TIM-barrel domain-containing protein [Micromonospora sp. LH3U1]WCN79572.1 glycoside hydrolase family 31 protein [Micromonospora sp. LH3U1]